jgi:UDP-glucose 4-epimerase
VTDLAIAHVKALDWIADKADDGKPQTFNIGTGVGHSVLEVIKSFEKVTGIDLPIQYAGRRAGDIEAIWADPSKAKHVLNWQARMFLDKMTKSAWEWQQYLIEKE